jgi:hypothetical protein
MKKPDLKRIATILTGALALALVAASAGSALTYAALHGTETLTLLGNSALQGIGIAIGGCLGGAIILRFKAARRFVKSIVHEINENPAAILKGTHEKG